MTRATLQLRFREAGLGPESFLAQQADRAGTARSCAFPGTCRSTSAAWSSRRGPLCELVPIENASMPGRTVIEWDKNDLDALGILKVDCLALGMLTAIRKAFAMVNDERADVRRTRATTWLAAHTIPRRRSAVYDMICQADTIGVFQIESRAQMSMLPRLQPRCFYDLVIEVAIVRPGPDPGGHGASVSAAAAAARSRSSIRTSGSGRCWQRRWACRSSRNRRCGWRWWRRASRRARPISCAARWAAWRRTRRIEPFRQKLLAGMKANGYGEGFAERVFRQIQGFGEYGFPESHAAGFALLVYVSAWLKRYYPAAFAAALINSQPMGFYAPAQIVADARKHGVEVRPVDVNFSQWNCTDGPVAAGLSLRSVLGTSRRHSAG